MGLFKFLDKKDINLISYVSKLITIPVIKF